MSSLTASSATQWLKVYEVMFFDASLLYYLPFGGIKRLETTPYAASFANSLPTAA